MAEHPGLLRAIIEDPEDDALRLVYADWLEENGETERADLIRVQDVLARHDPAYAPEEVVEQESFLLLDHRRRFLRPFFDLGLTACTDRFAYGADRGFTFHFQRGLVEALEVWCAVAARLFVDRADEIFDRTPLLHLRFHAVPCEPHGEALFAFYPMDLPTFRRLMALPQLTRLRSLDLADNGLRNDEARILLASPHLGPGTRVFLSLNQFTPLVQQQLLNRFGNEAVSMNPFWMHNQ
jgi:uncharacterized protein (TIGR02996 family)